jgi:opacity protein-like surface antigen
MGALGIERAKRRQTGSGIDGRGRVVKRAAAFAVVIVGLAVSVPPRSAQAGGSPVIAEGVAAGVLTGLVCTVVALNADKEGAKSGEFDRQGWYLGAAGSYAVESFDLEALPDLENAYPFASLSADNSFGFNGDVGYRCHPRLAGEVEVEWLDGFDADLSDPVLGHVASTDIEALAVTANLKGYLLTGRYQPFLLFGGGVIQTESNLQDALAPGIGISNIEKETEFAFRFGGGIDLYATKNVVVTLDADYVMPFGNLDELDFITIGWGFQYRF